MRIILHQTEQWRMGGIEKFNLNFCKRLCKYYDITFLYNSGDPRQIAELSKYVKTVRFDNQVFETDLVIFSSVYGFRPEDNINADKCVQMIHADFLGMDQTWKFVLKPLKKVDEYWTGGENMAKTFEEKFGIKCKIIPYLLDDEVKVEKVLHLISTTRFAKEKGMDRMIQMAKMLDQYGRKWNWDIWGDGFDPAFNAKFKKGMEDFQEVSFRGLGYNLASNVAEADYLVQLSNTEGYAFAIAEALQLETPVISTNFANAYEQITDGVNGYIVKMDLSDLSIEKIYNNIPYFHYKEISTEQDWINVIGKPDGKRKKTKIITPKQSKVKCIKKYFDVKLQSRVKRDKIYDVEVNRAKELENKGLVMILKEYS